MGKKLTIFLLFAAKYVSTDCQNCCCDAHTKMICWKLKAVSDANRRVVDAAVVVAVVVAVVKMKENIKIRLHSFRR